MESGAALLRTVRAVVWRQELRLHHVVLHDAEGQASAIEIGGVRVSHRKAREQLLRTGIQIGFIEDDGARQPGHRWIGGVRSIAWRRENAIEHTVRRPVTGGT